MLDQHWEAVVVTGMAMNQRAKCQMANLMKVPALYWHVEMAGTQRALLAAAAEVVLTGFAVRC